MSAFYFITWFYHLFNQFPIDSHVNLFTFFSFPFFQSFQNFQCSYKIIFTHLQLWLRDMIRPCVFTNKLISQEAVIQVMVDMTEPWSIRFTLIENWNPHTERLDMLLSKAKLLWRLEFGGHVELESRGSSLYGKKSEDKPARKAAR